MAAVSRSPREPVFRGRVSPRPPSPLRQGIEIPGYAGYVPGKYAGNVHGVSFKLANEGASQGPGAAKNGGLISVPQWSAPAVSRSPSRGPKRSPSPASNSRGPPGARLQSPVEGPTHLANSAGYKNSLGYLPKPGASRAPMPIPVAAGGHKVPTMAHEYAARDPMVTSHSADFPATRAVPRRTAGNCTPSSEGSGGRPARCARKAVPGYGGFVPGKFAENVLGKTFKVANQAGVAEFDAMRKQKSRTTQQGSSSRESSRQRVQPVMSSQEENTFSGSRSPSPMPGGNGSSQIINLQRQISELQQDNQRLRERGSQSSVASSRNAGPPSKDVARSPSPQPRELYRTSSQRSLPRNEDLKEIPRANSAGRIPGYRGHVRGRVSENVFGVSFAGTREDK